MYTTLFNKFLTSGDTLWVLASNKLLFTSNKDGLLPLLEYIDGLAHNQQPVAIFDKVMGNAAALLSIKANGEEVYSPLASQIAVDTLKEYGIRYHFKEIVPYISKPGQEEMCPMEKLSLHKGPVEFYHSVKNYLNR